MAIGRTGPNATLAHTGEIRPSEQRIAGAVPARGVNVEDALAQRGPVLSIAVNPGACPYRPVGTGCELGGSPCQLPPGQKADMMADPLYRCRHVIEEEQS